MPSFVEVEVLIADVNTFFLNAAKMWCYCRMVYMPMSYLYGKRFVGPITPLILQLREELYAQPYDEVNWKKVRHFCAKVDAASTNAIHDRTISPLYSCLIIHVNYFISTN